MRGPHGRERREVAVPDGVALGVAPLAQVLVVAVEPLLVKRGGDAVLELALLLRSVEREGVSPVVPRAREARASDKTHGEVDLELEEGRRALRLGLAVEALGAVGHLTLELRAPARSPCQRVELTQAASSERQGRLTCSSTILPILPSPPSTSARLACFLNS